MLKLWIGLITTLPCGQAIRLPCYYRVTTMWLLDYQAGDITQTHQNSKITQWNICHFQIRHPDIEKSNN